MYPTSYDYPDQFMTALGAWQNGWGEDNVRRLELSTQLKEAIESMPALPPEAKTIPKFCYRKRFLVPNNPQNDGDFWPFFWNGEIPEGIASWSTDYNYCKVIFKPRPRPGTIACIFRRAPVQNEVLLNIVELWKRSDFVSAADNYINKGGSYSTGIRHFRDLQSEVVLDAPLTLDDVIAFCGEVPSLERLCADARITKPDDEDDLWRKLVEAKLQPTLPYWLEGQASQNAIDAAIKTFKQKWRQRLKPKPHDTNL